MARINQVCELCIKARDSAGSGGERCDYCIVFGDAGSCSEVRLAITEALLAGDLDEARRAVSAVLVRVACARAPEAA